VLDAHIHVDELAPHQFGDSLWRDPDYRAIIPGVEPQQSIQTRDRFQHEPRLRQAIALHPWWVMDETDGPDASATFAQVAELAAQPWVLAVGETGLDHLKCPPGHAAAERVDAYFTAHARLACELGKPLIVHAVRCHAAVLRTLQPWLRQGVRCMIHAYAGSSEETRNYLRAGCYLSIGPPVTRPGSRRVRTAAVEIPLDRLLIETDAPAMAAGLERRMGEGEIDDIRRVAAEIAGLRGISVQALTESTNASAHALFGEW
jgi:TatD DNase family protein